MPFGRKRDDSGRVIDFDAIYECILGPAAVKAGLEAIRGDHEHVGGTIHKAMFERLLLCEYAIADLTTANPNVYYELGVRHSLRPRSTVLAFATGTALPFDVAPVRGMPYVLDASGTPVDPEACAASIAARLRILREEHADDSPVFQLVQDMPRIEVDHEKTDLFRERTDYSRRFKERLAEARARGAPAVIAVAADPALADVAGLEMGVVIDLYLSLRAVKAHAAMVELYGRMAAPLQRARLVREQYGFALNRLGRGAEAERVLKSVIDQYGVSSETNGLLGRVYKDRWEAAVKAGEHLHARGAHKLALETYLAGFHADWRDAYPGINAVTLMELGETPDPRQEDIAPVVRFAAARKASGTRANYWDHATLLESAVLVRDRRGAETALSDALARVKSDEPWEAETTANNLRLIREARTARGEASEWIEAIEAALLPATEPHP